VVARRPERHVDVFEVSDLPVLAAIADIALVFELREHGTDTPAGDARALVNLLPWAGFGTATA
jgi:hypothetical protein